MSQISFHKTRIAPTPSGFLHIGNAASFLFTVALAKKANAKLLLRIDDLDRERVQREYMEDIFDTLNFLEIDWQEGPKNYAEYKQTFSQVYRMDLYKKTLQQLREQQLVFACRCSRTQLQNGSTCRCREQKISFDAPQVSWRLITDVMLQLNVLTMDGNCKQKFLPHSMTSFIVRKKDGLPAYQLASLIDDEYFGVDAIVRGQDLWDSTLAQQYLAKVLRKSFFETVYFYHHPLLMDVSSNNKLSKSDGAASIRFLHNEGKAGDKVIKIIQEQIAAWQPE